MRARAAGLLALLALAGCDEDAPEPVARVCHAFAPINADDPTSGMIRVPGGVLRMGAENQWPEEAPVRDVAVDTFWISETEITNAMFEAFVAATGYRTRAEQGLSEAEAPEISPALRAPGSIVFPAVQIAYEDALAYARWRGHDLPTEAEWEWAARGSLVGKTYAWGDTFRPDGKPMANTWEGVFPLWNQPEDGFAGRAPVGCYPPNGYGLYDMTGNVWEWTRDGYRGEPGAHVIKGGSYLCAENFCARYRPAARQPGAPETGTSHIGFRTVYRERTPLWRITRTTRRVSHPSS